MHGKTHLMLLCHESIPCVTLTVPSKTKHSLLQLQSLQIYLVIIRTEKRNLKNFTHLAWVKIPLPQQGTQTEFCSVSASHDILVGVGKTLQIGEFAEKQSAN